MKRRHPGQLAHSLAAALWAAFLLAAPAAWLPLPAQATVPTASNTITVAGNGSQTAFAFPFIGVAASDVVVVYTDASGNQTTLVQGPGPTQYQVTLNAVVPPSLWGIGGTVTYNPSGTPIAGGTTLTISRVLPLQQGTSLQNQASFGQYASATEQALDNLAMQTQQVGGQIGRALMMNAANTVAPLPLPPAAQAVGKGLCFDGTGNNVVACLLAPSAAISSAMAPVVDAATLADAKTLLGLGTMANENINGGTCGGATIQDDGTGNARVVFGTVSDATSQSVTCAFHGTVRSTTGSLVYTLPQSSTLFNGFGFWIYANNQGVTLTPNASDSIAVGGVALPSGTSFPFPAGSQTYVTTNAAGTWLVSNIDSLTIRAAPGLNVPYNMSIACALQRTP